jgi:hypothetical protein
LDHFLISKQFYQQIAQLVANSGIGTPDAILKFCDNRNLDYEYIAPFILKNPAVEESASNGS